MKYDNGWKQSDENDRLIKRDGILRAKLEVYTDAIINEITSRIKRHGSLQAPEGTQNIFSPRQLNRFESLRQAWIRRGDRDHLFYQRDPEMFIQILTDQAESMCDEEPETINETERFISRDNHMTI